MLIHHLDNHGLWIIWMTKPPAMGTPRTLLTLKASPFDFR